VDVLIFTISCVLPQHGKNVPQHLRPTARAAWQSEESGFAAQNAHHSVHPTNQNKPLCSHYRPHDG